MGDGDHRGSVMHAQTRKQFSLSTIEQCSAGVLPTDRKIMLRSLGEGSHSQGFRKAGYDSQSFPQVFHD